ncbi:hypothetical protein M3P19_09770 [Muricauda sp. 2012CJ35-5]|uniref:Arabinogalactan endo-beta-1,4-galactanase n=1 Tax=Flagellimonas spongiicola TaxID=2942208 RepID=A0ABT0PSC4_9FLAO|nr:hypothetical protein [Allomuricauda spongiicola]MCL6274298.1 hypothetical protein [Allomuricauda spongiicola]
MIYFVLDKTKIFSMRSHFVVFLTVLLFSSCSNDETTPEIAPERNFKMGFTTWSFGPNPEDVNTTYAFLGNHGDIYTEHIDNSIPWNAWINDGPLPLAFTNEIAGKVQRKIAGLTLLLSVGLFNLNRDELALDFDGNAPSYTDLDDADIENAYFKHIDYLVDAFEPDYLVIAIEVNELSLNAPEKWEAYKSLITEVKTRIEQSHPGVKISESISLHNLFQPDTSNPEAHIQDLFNHINQNEFVAISFYPFLKNLGTKSQFQEVFDFLHNNTNRPIAFVETGHIAENLVIPNLGVSINGNEEGQNAYLETLLENATNHDYEFISWWAHRDFDALWETFPEEVKDLGQLWRDTGLLDENGNERAAFLTWSNQF